MQLTETINLSTGLRVEEKLSLDSLHTGVFGTPDAVAVRDRFVFLRDYKFGHHHHVDEFENRQLIAYSYPLVETLSAQEELDTFEAL